MGVYGNYYFKRAIVALLGLGANQAEDAVYPLLTADAKGDPPPGRTITSCISTPTSCRPPSRSGR